MVEVKSILIKQGAPRRAHKCNVIFEQDVVIIGGEKVPLAPPANTNDDLAFDYNPPAHSPATPMPAKGGRKGTMRIKGAGKGMSPYAAALAAEEERQKQEAAAAGAQASYLQAGYMKLLKESGMKSSWTKRYVTLTPTALAYHRSADAFKPLKTFDITDECFVREISQRTGVTDCRNSLEVIFTRNKSIVLKGTSQREATEWITAICAAVDALGGGADDEEFDFVDEDEFDFVDEEAATTPTASATAAAPAIALAFSESNPFDDNGGAAADSREESEESSFEWVDEDADRTSAAAPAASTKAAALPRTDDTVAKKKAEEEARAKEKAAAEQAAKKKAEQAAQEARAKEKAAADEVALKKKKAEDDARRKKEQAAAAAATQKKQEEAEREKRAQAAAEAERKRKEAFIKRQAPASRAGSAPVSAASAARPGSRPHGLSGASGISKTRPNNSKVGSLLKMFEQP